MVSDRARFRIVSFLIPNIRPEIANIEQLACVSDIKITIYSGILNRILIQNVELKDFVTKTI